MFQTAWRQRQSYSVSQAECSGAITAHCSLHLPGLSDPPKELRR
ncbi:LOW QUALITY PROTEIN: ZNF620 isoform 4 [Pongo abelii]|uniref:ZNF620 isoform 4 n=1 Tax=Pongo abelii TaxID=9601 RepID=A0A2J8WXX8_PONAB|nr:LOW QUALITY PROTEIN: ZNF620 isoform 4 [Pongo abelii]